MIHAGSRCSPIELVGAAGEVTDTIDGVVARHGGTVRELLSDEAVAVFAGHDDDVLRALRAATDLRELLPAGVRARMVVDRRAGDIDAVHRAASRCRCREHPDLGQRTRPRPGGGRRCSARDGRVSRAPVRFRCRAVRATFRAAPRRSQLRARAARSSARRRDRHGDRPQAGRGRRSGRREDAARPGTRPACGRPRPGAHRAVGRLRRGGGAAPAVPDPPPGGQPRGRARR